MREVTGKHAKVKLFSVTIKDCRVDCFTVGGHGGSGKDTSNTGVRVTHEPSGASGKATDTRSQSKNKQLAFRRMGESKEFQAWARRVVAEMTHDIDNQVNLWLTKGNLKIEGQDGQGRWVEID